MTYNELIFKIPQESKTYREDSAFVVNRIISILDTRKNIGDNKIILNTNLKLGLPLENINKIAGPMIEAWAFEVFSGIRDGSDNNYSLINVEAQERLGMADITFQYRTTWEMCQLLDQKFLSSSRRTFEDFYREAVKHKWIKN